MKAYPKYRDSEVLWCRKVPQHWESHRAKFLFKKMNRPIREDDDVVTCFRDGIVTLRKNRRTKGFTESLKEIGYQGIRKGDLVIHQMDAFAGAVGVSDSDGKGTPVYSVCYPKKELEPEYFAHLVREMARNEYILSLAKGIRERSTDFRFDTFGAQLLPFPPLTEQQQISRYLDWQTAKINKFIKAKKKLIALLKEQKQNVINEAVTKGMNPDVEMKDSGVVWIGKIPEHWHPVRLKHCVSSIDQGWSPQCEAQPAEANDWGVLKVGCVNGDHFNSLQNKKLPDGLTPKLQCRIQENDIVVSRANTRELVGLAAIVDKNYPNILLCDKLYRFTAITDAAVASFLVYLIRCSSSREQIEERATGASSTMQNISQSVIRNLLIPLPPVIEQQSIVEYIDQETALINKTIARTEREIELIQEYRTRLISDVVTGKIDVRSIEIPDFEPVEADLEVQDDEESQDERITEGIEE